MENSNLIDFIASGNIFSQEFQVLCQSLANEATHYKYPRYEGIDLEEKLESSLSMEVLANIIKNFKRSKRINKLDYYTSYKMYCSNLSNYEKALLQYEYYALYMQNIVESHIILAEKTNLTFNPYNIKDEDFSYNDGKPTSLITYAGLAWYTVIKGLSKNLTRHPNDVNIILDAFRDIALKEYKKYEHQRYVKNLIMSVPEDNKKNN